MSGLVEALAGREAEALGGGAGSLRHDDPQNIASDAIAKRNPKDEGAFTIIFHIRAHNRMTHEPRFDKNRSDATKADAGNPGGVVEEA